LCQELDIRQVRHVVDDQLFKSKPLAFFSALYRQLAMAGPTMPGIMYSGKVKWGLV
jgi:hypothetical protein